MLTGPPDGDRDGYNVQFGDSILLEPPVEYADNAVSSVTAVNQGFRGEAEFNS